MRRWHKLPKRAEKGDPINIYRIMIFATASGVKVKKGKIYVLRDVK